MIVIFYLMSKRENPGFGASHQKRPRYESRIPQENLTTGDSGYAVSSGIKNKEAECRTGIDPGIESSINNSATMEGQMGLMEQMTPGPKLSSGRREPQVFDRILKGGIRTPLEKLKLSSPGMPRLEEPQKRTVVQKSMSVEVDDKIPLSFSIPDEVEGNTTTDNAKRNLHRYFLTEAKPYEAKGVAMTLVSEREVSKEHDLLRTAEPFPSSHMSVKIKKEVLSSANEAQSSIHEQVSTIPSDVKPVHIKIEPIKSSMELESENNQDENNADQKESQEDQLNNDEDRDSKKVYQIVDPIKKLDLAIYCREFEMIEGRSPRMKDIRSKFPWVKRRQALHRIKNKKS